jgi:hypothetical protein
VSLSRFEPVWFKLLILNIGFSGLVDALAEESSVISRVKALQALSLFDERGRPDAEEYPIDTFPLKHALSLHVGLVMINPVPVITIAFNRQSRASPSTTRSIAL